METKIQSKSKSGIRIEVCPEKCIGINLHSHGIISEECWNGISHRVRFRQRNVCQCCGVKIHDGPAGDMSKMVAHEVWYFDKENQVQTLVEIICICVRCHLTIHYLNLLKSSKINERESIISKSHYMEVNCCTEAEFENDLNDALSLYRELNLVETWVLDISYVLSNEYLMYEDIQFENLEKFTPNAAELLKSYKKEPQIHFKKFTESVKVCDKESRIRFGKFAKSLNTYKKRPGIHFNKLPESCLIDYAEEEYQYNSEKLCDLCARPSKILCCYYDLQLKEKSSELYLAGKKKICPMCRETIYFGSQKRLKKSCSTTKHYMTVNQCSYAWFKYYAKDARSARKRHNGRLYICLKLPQQLPDGELEKLTEYLGQHGAKFDGKNNWYLYPKRKMHLKEFLPYL